MVSLSGHVGSSGFDLAPSDPVPSAWPVFRATVEPSGLAVSLTDARDFIGLPTTDTSRDAELTAFIKAATRAIERFCQLSLMDTTWEASQPDFTDRILLAKRPFSSFTSLEYVRETDGEILTVASTEYLVARVQSEMGMLFKGEDVNWPTDGATRHDNVRATFVAGYGTDHTSVPDDIRLALLMTVSKMDADRGDCDETGGTVYAMKNSTPSIIPSSAQPLLAPYCYHHLAVT